MDNDQLKQLIESKLEGVRATVESDDGRHFEVQVVGEIFADKTMVAQQQLVYSAIAEHIQSGEIHAISIDTQTR